MCKYNNYFYKTARNLQRKLQRIMYRFKMKRKREVAKNLCKESLQSKIEKILTVVLCKIMQKRTFAKDYFVILLFFVCFCVSVSFFCRTFAANLNDWELLIEIQLLKDKLNL